MPDTRTANQRELDRIRSNYDLDYAPRPGSQPKTLEFCCERCVYGTGQHRVDCVRLPGEYAVVELIPGNPLSLIPIPRSFLVDIAMSEIQK